MNPREQIHVLYISWVERVHYITCNIFILQFSDPCSGTDIIRTWSILQNGKYDEPRKSSYVTAGGLSWLGVGGGGVQNLGLGYPPPPKCWTKAHLWKHYCPHPSDAGGKNAHFKKPSVCHSVNWLPVQVYKKLAGIEPFIRMENRIYLIYLLDAQDFMKCVVSCCWDLNISFCPPLKLWRKC